MYAAEFPGNCRAKVYSGIWDHHTIADAVEINKKCKPNNQHLLVMITIKDIGPDCFVKLLELGWEDVVSYKGAYANYPMTMLVKANPWVEPNNHPTRENY